MGASASSNKPNGKRSTPAPEVTAAPVPMYSPDPTTTKESFTPVEVPVDDEGYIQSFALDQREEYIDFFKRFGFVVVNGVLNAEEVGATVDEIWDEVSELSKGLRPRKKKKTTEKDSSDEDTEVYTEAKRDNPNTWDMWPCGPLGILGADIAAGPMAWKNRISPNVYQVYADLLGTKHLLVSLDRYGIMRPTKQVEFPRSGKKSVVRDRPEWKTNSEWFHWDLAVWGWFGLDSMSSKYDDDDEDDDRMLARWGNTLSAATGFITENNSKANFKGYEKVQGLVSLCDSKDNGGFITVPGFHNFLETWARQTAQYSRGGFVPCPKDDPLTKLGIKITMRKGSLVVWSSKMPHCNYPNEASEFRYCQYIKMFPACVVPAKELPLRAAALKARLPEDFQLTDLAQMLFGFTDKPISDDQDEAEEEKENQKEKEQKEDQPQIKEEGKGKGKGKEKL